MAMYCPTYIKLIKIKFEFTQNWLSYIRIYVGEDILASSKIYKSRLCLHAQFMYSATRTCTMSSAFIHA